MDCVKLKISNIKQNTDSSMLERFNTLRTGDTDLRFYVTTVHDG